MTAGIDPIGIAVDGSTGTLYVANASGTVAVVDGRQVQRRRHLPLQRAAGDRARRLEPAVPRGRREDAHGVRGQQRRRHAVGDRRARVQRPPDDRLQGRGDREGGPQPFTLAVNDVTGSLYVADLGAGTVSVDRCEQLQRDGCQRLRAQARRPCDVGASPGGIALDSKTNTIYVTGQVGNDVWVIDGNACNARRTSGCARTPVRVAAGPGARGIALNQRDGHRLRRQHGGRHGERDRRLDVQRDRAQRLPAGRAAGARRTEPAARRRRRGDEHGLRDERRLELGHDAERAHVQRPRARRLPDGRRPRRGAGRGTTTTKPSTGPVA